MYLLSLIAAAVFNAAIVFAIWGLIGLPLTDAILFYLLVWVIFSDARHIRRGAAEEERNHK